MIDSNAKNNTSKNAFAKTGEALKLYIKNYWWKLLIIAFLIAVDLVTKTLIVRFDQNGNVIQNQVDIIKGGLIILPTANKGAAWSILSGKTNFLIILTFLFLIVFIIFDVLNKKKSVFYGIATAMVFAGAIGNLIDRIAFGKVRDFIYFAPINFPVFNVADVCLTVGIILFGVYIVFFMGKNKKTDTNSQNNSMQNNQNNLIQNNQENLSQIKQDNLNETNSHKINNNDKIFDELSKQDKNLDDTTSQNKNKGDSDAKDNG